MMKDFKKIQEDLKKLMDNKLVDFDNAISKIENESHKEILIKAMNKAKTGKMSIEELNNLSKQFI